jgi:hypothetical protein
MQAPLPPVHEFLGISLEGWLTLVAIALSPLIALLIQRKLDSDRAKTDRQVKIYRDLMSHRASRLSANYVQALNGIETEFYGKDDVLSAWHSMVDHLNSKHGADDPLGTRWSEKCTDRLNDLLYVMGKSLGYNIEKSVLSRNAYVPSGWNQIEEEQAKVRQAAIKVLEGDGAIKVDVVLPKEPSVSQS